MKGDAAHFRGQVSAKPRVLAGGGGDGINPLVFLQQREFLLPTEDVVLRVHFASFIREAIVTLAELAGIIKSLIVLAMKGSSHGLATHRSVACQSVSVD
jgi:hypothetical protein